MQLDPARKIGDGREIPEYLSYPVLEEVAVRLFLHLDEIGHVDDFVHLGETAPLGVAVLHFTGLNFGHIFSLNLFFRDNKKSPQPRLSRLGFGSLKHSFAFRSFEQFPILDNNKQNVRFAPFMLT